MMKEKAIRSDCAIKIRADVLEASRDDVHDKNEPGGVRRWLGSYEAIRRVR